MLAGPEAIAEGVRRLRAGRPVAFPTETVYGLGAIAFDEAAVRRVFETKGRPSTNPLIVHVCDETMAKRVVAAWPERASRIARAMWPGPVTLVLEKHADVPDVVTAGGPTAAVRVPDHPLTLALIEALGEPLVGPSANPSGYVSPTTAGHVRGHFDDDAVFVLDGGACRAGIESTVVDLLCDPPVVLRRGVVGADAIAAVLGCTVVDREGPVALAAGTADVARSPGHVGPHYQPRARVVLAADMAAVDRAMAEAGGACAVLSPPGVPLTVDPPHTVITMPAGAWAYAADVYAALREADAAGVSAIVVCEPMAVDGDAAVWSAVLERLRRAAT